MNRFDLQELLIKVEAVDQKVNKLLSITCGTCDEAFYVIDDVSNRLWDGSDSIVYQ